MTKSTIVKSNLSTASKAQKIKVSPTWVRFTHWEYWPSWLANIPHIIFYLFFSIRAKAFIWMSAANPSIITGGLIGEPKNLIYDLMPEHLIPKTVYIESPNCSFEEVLERVAAAGIQFPVIAKPNRGERGRLVAKLDNKAALEDYCNRIKVDFVVQDYVAFPNEAAVLVYYMPDSAESGIISVTLKEFLKIEGDGVSTVLELMEANLRAYMVLDSLKQRYAKQLGEVLAKGEIFALEPIGNHCRGTGFFSGMHLVNEEMIKAYVNITQKIEGVYFCRYDLKYDKIEDLILGNNIKILELNGVGADPAHIYDPKLSIWQKYGVVYQTWKTMFRVAMANKKKGMPVMSAKSFRAYLKEIKAYNQLMDQFEG